MKHRKITILISFILVLLFASPALASVTLDINGRNYQSSDAPNLKDGSILTPLDVIEKTLGCNVLVNDKTITLKENQNTLVMTLGSKTALFNGQEKEMNKSPELINSKIYVPLRFVYECFGANVTWLNQSETAKISYDETRNGMTVDEVIAKSSDKMKQAERYKMSTKAKYDIDMTMQEKGKASDNMKMKSDADITAWVQMQPMIMYMKQKAVVESSDLSATEPQTVETEMLLNETGMYIIMPETGWVKMDLGVTGLQEMMKQSMNQDPATTMQQMKDMGMSLAFANDEEKNGHKYWVIESRMGNDALKSDYFKQIISQMQSIDKSTNLQDMMNNMVMDLSYTTWIDQETMYNDFIVLKGTIKFPMDIPATDKSPGGKMTMLMDITADYAISDYGKTFTVPDVSKAKNMNEVLPQK